MKHFMIKYQFANGNPEQWHQEVGRFIAALDNDPDLKGRIVYRVMKNRDDSAIFISPRPPTTRRSRRCRAAISSSTIRNERGRSPAARSR